MKPHELERKAKKAGCLTETGGPHPKLITPNGVRIPYPKHPGDIAPGTLKAILKLLKAAGVVLAVYLVVLINSLP